MRAATVISTRKKQSENLSKVSKKKAPGSVGDSITRGLEEAVAHKRGELRLRTRQILVPDDVDVRQIRERTGLSQSQFAERYGFSPRTLQEWEQGRTRPDTAVRAYLTVIAHDPAAVENALAG